MHLFLIDIKHVNLSTLYTVITIILRFPMTIYASVLYIWFYMRFKAKET